MFPKDQLMNLLSTFTLLVCKTWSAMFPWSLGDYWLYRSSWAAINTLFLFANKNVSNYKDQIDLWQLTNSGSTHGEIYMTWIQKGPK